MFLTRQRGALSLFWSAVLMAALAFAALAGLFAMRYERNLIAESWHNLMRSSVVSSIVQSRAAIENNLKSEAGAVRKCVIDGKVMYSNVDCGAGTPGSRIVELHDNLGIEPPKAALAAAAQSEPPTSLKNMEKMIERAND